MFIYVYVCILHNDRAYENKLKPTYRHVIRCFRKLFQTVSQMLMIVDKPKQANPNSSFICGNMIIDRKDRKKKYFWYFGLVIV